VISFKFDIIASHDICVRFLSNFECFINEESKWNDRMVV